MEIASLDESFSSTSLLKAHSVISSLVLPTQLSRRVNDKVGELDSILSGPWLAIQPLDSLSKRLFTIGLLVVYERIFQESKHISLLVLMLILQDSLTLWSFIFHIHSFTSFVFFLSVKQWLT